MVYNPTETATMLLFKAQGCSVKNGLEMLHLQADRAWEIWNS
jgi:shikimate dehydrogenase